ncbi:MAG: hypothetical protein WBB01_10665, partial [Phormidesmis sp.]
TAQGDIIYVFNLAAVRGGGTSQAQAASPEATWAYAHQARAERARAEKAQTAWANAKQIRTLRQLSKCDLGRTASESSAQALAPNLQKDTAESTTGSREGEATDIVTIDVPAVRG